MLPSFTYPTSQIVSASQFDEHRFHLLREWFGWAHGYNRKLWEYLYILGAFEREGIARGKRYLGFGCGKELIPGLITQRGGYVVATDYMEDAKRFGLDWASEGLDDLFTSHVVTRGARRDLAEFRHVDMNAIPGDLRDFDGLWSCGSLEHIGGLNHGLDFIENAMVCLKPGGIAVHTTELNISAGEATLETPQLSLYRRQHIEGLIDRLKNSGHQIDMNWQRGDTPRDDPERRDSGWELSIVADVGGFDTTSIGLLIRKAR